MQANIEEQAHEKWTENYYTMRDHVLGAIPYPLRIIIGWMAYRQNVQTLHGQGIGRFSSEEIAAMRAEIWENLSTLLLSAKRVQSNEYSDGVFWIHGRRTPSEIDAVCFGFIVSALISKS